MSRWLKISLRVGGLILSLFLVAWILLAAYVYTHKKEILTAITTQLNEDLSGKLTIKRMEPSLIRGFPGISVSLEDVLLRDSLWSIHKHDLLRAKNVYVAINAFSILSGSIKIRDIELKSAEIYLLTDSSGLRNTEIFKKKKPSDNKGGITKNINRVHLKDVKLTIDDQQKHKLFKFSIINFRGSIKQRIGGWEGNVKTLTQVDFFAFNLKKGSFLKGKLLDLDLDMNYSDKTGQLNIPMQEIMINKDDLIIGGNLNFSSENSDYLIEVQAPSILFKDAKSLLSSHIISKLQPYDVKKPLDVSAVLSGKFKQGGDPLIKVDFTAKDNILSTRGESITDCSFTGIYTNEWKKGLPHKDPNSLIAFYNLAGNFYDIPFKADSIQITDLRDPVFTGKF
ncbi:MAG: AsmA family protein, partial [Daejeonella sp.]|nr:AsmA family protein [Daejeonella sp.]